MTIDDIAKKETERYEIKTCAPGPIDPLLDRPLWPCHKYTAGQEWKELYCPTHQEIYKRYDKK